MERKLFLSIAYDGAPFCGYQAQNNGPSVQRELNRATEELFGFPCDITGCSRTDSGVHARMFCAAVTRHGCPNMDCGVPLDRLPGVINRHLPDAVAVWNAQWVPTDFHPRYDVTSKEYVYEIDNAPARDPFAAGRAWHIPVPITDDQLSAMQTAAAAFVGQRNFASCMAAGSKIVDPTRHVFSASVERSGRHIRFTVRADGFLYHMVRIMAGTLADVAAGHIDPSTIPARLDAKDRRMMGRTAPAAGLYLNRVFYNDPERAGYFPPEKGGDDRAT